MPSINLFSGRIDPTTGQLARNPADDLIFQGPLVDVVLNVPAALAQALIKAGLPLPTPVTGKALVDTGAGVTGIDDGAAFALGLVPSGTIKLGSATETKECPQYFIAIDIPSATDFYREAHQVVGMTLASQGLLMLIGRDLLRDCHMTYNGTLGLITISY